jgi:hypothetical protein
VEKQSNDALNLPRAKRDGIRSNFFDQDYLSSELLLELGKESLLLGSSAIVLSSC